MKIFNLAFIFLAFQCTPLFCAQQAMKVDQKTNQTPCSICFADFDSEENTDKKKTTSCSKITAQAKDHEFHEGCLQAWLNQGKSTCPLCRTKIIDEMVLKEFEAALDSNQIVKFRDLLKKHPALANCFKDPKLATTVLHYASQKGLVNMVDALVRQDAKVDATNSSKDTPLHLAAMFGHYCSLHVLIKFKGNIHAKNNDGQTPLHLAAANGWNITMARLIQRGAKIDDQDNQGQTPLHCAAINGWENATELLISYGADTKMKDNSGKTALQNAVLYGQTEVAAFLAKFK